MDFLSRIIQFVVLCVVILIVLALVNWSSVSRFKIEKDLRDYARSVRQSNLILDDKERLLDVIERLEDRIKSGEQINWRQWCLHNQTIWEMLDEGVEGDEARLVERELERTEEDFQFVQPSDDEA